MKAVLPGQPEASLQAVSTGYWDDKRVIVYITGNALAILSDPETIIQTIYDNDERKLDAVSFDECSGKIAACTDATVRIYRPLSHGDDGGLPKWALQTSFEVDGGPTPITLSWGSAEELLVARSSLWLYDTTSTPPSCHWQQELASPAKAANLSYDSSYIASIGYHDRLVKVWRRLNFSSEEIQFDFGYLSHPRAVTSIQWRKPIYVDQTIENVLYTFCADNVMRAWTGADSSSRQSLLHHWGQLDLAAAVRDGRETGKQNPVWAFILSQRDLANATERAVQERGDGQEKEDVALQYLLSIANRDTEICVVFDGRGSMSSWALESISNKLKGTSNVDNVAYVKSKDFDFLGSSAKEYHVEILSYCNKISGNLHILFHHFDGRIEVFESSIADFLDPTSKAKTRLIPRATWSGHSASVKKIVRNFSGRAIVSRTEQGESIVWRHTPGPLGTKLLRHNVIPEKRHIHRICLIRGGRFVVFLHHESISVWDCTSSTHTLLADLKYHVRGKPLCIIVLPRERVDDYSVAHIATVTSEQEGIVWELHLPMEKNNSAKTHINSHKKGLREFCTFKLEDAGDLAYVLPVDPAGISHAISGFLDVFARDVAVSYTHGGRVEFWTARISKERSQVEWLSTSSMETGIPEPVLVSGSTMKKAALANAQRSELTIWDIRGARLEYKQDFENHNPVQDLDWTSTPDSQSILAVGFPYRILLLSQMRFDYLNKGPAWAPVREINIRDFTPHPIGDSTWLSDGNLVIGAGNQLFSYDRTFEITDRLISSARVPHRKNGTRDLFNVIQRLNGPLPVFHPQFLSQCILAGKHGVVRRVLLALNNTLKYHIEGESIDDYLGLDLADFYIRKGSMSIGSNGSSYLMSQMSFDDTDEIFTEDIALAVCEKLQQVTIPQLSGHEQIQLVDIVECVGVVEKQRRSMDENGARFILFFRQHALRKGRTNEIHMSWREINWAYHSTSQDILTDFVSRQYHGTMLWENARESGMFMWLADEAAVKVQFEIVARNEYTKSEMKNPVDCSLFYLALKKKTVLQGLWRMATWNREQGATQRLLANNFEDPKWKTTALKNAYALLSKRRFGYAAAFFLLAGHLQDAVNVCINQIKDIQLAIAIARVYEGDNGPVLRKLLENEVLALAAQEGNRWLASWAFWMLKRRDMAVRALITPVYTLLETPVSSDNLKAKLFLTDDPALVVLYSQLRQKTLQTLRGASKVMPRTEWEFVLHNARLYDRMGCDLLGLDLVRNWEFLRHATPTAPDLGGEIDPSKLLRRRSSLVVQDMPMSHVARTDMKTGGHGVKPPPSVFEEPDTNSLLDSFGF
ncbi:regulator of V-ATPase in vacuolar membrane protein [Daldinia decipiens]|uniref:regulator of V-ATPase in vacuolar membrane protein n=1 Tax=Daldinia decipiens TaxID=326647 RepID=UPI0020C33592|nr:regulator of V-ATPase in vacuolar membrane protein [Daldinia decipiens]KAI1654207.1 regulator of V-ATPase in vacuolar membrane protein [Daldinia decipiens]